MSLSVTVTGATGFLGNNLVRQLIEAGFQVTAIVRNETAHKPFEGLDLTLIEGELDDENVLEKALGQADVLVHAAAYIWLGVTKLPESRRINVGLTKSLAEAARRYKTKMIHVSTVDVLASSRKRDQILDETNVTPMKSKTSYSISKSEAEQVILEQVKLGLDGVIVNPAFMIGPWDWKPSSGKMIQAIANGFIPMAPAGGFSVADVRDVCRGIISAIHNGREGERYILGGHNMTYFELWKRFAKKSGKTWPRYRLGPAVAFVVGMYGNIRRSVFRNETEVNSASVSVAQKYSYYSSEKAEKELEYVISPLEPAIDDAFKWLRDYGYL